MPTVSRSETPGLLATIAAYRFRYWVVRRIRRAVAARLRRWGLGVFPCAADRGPPPSCSEAWLQRQYEASGHDALPHTYVLYRIIGNDLVPRHARGQSRANVRFILENEPCLEGCDKRWVVNRIADEHEEAAICRLLEAYDQPYIRIPFEREAYDSQSWDFAALPEPGWSYRVRDYGATRDVIRSVEYRLYRHRNNYAIHNNGARNVALGDGRQRAKWVLPWDGNCFVTQRAWNEIRERIEQRPWYPYFVVPMARMTANTDLLRSDRRPVAEDEPQVIFRNDARERFDETHPYGRRPKVELLWRLGVPGPWDHWRIEPWDLPCPDYAAEAGGFLWAGWVARLFSGQAHLEAGSRHAISRRSRTRADAVLEHLGRLDRAAFRDRFDAHRLHAYGGTALAAPQAVPGGMNARAALLRSADAALDGGRVFSGDCGSVGLDRSWQWPAFGIVTLCALAWWLTGSDAYAHHAARVLDSTFPGSEPPAGIGRREARTKRGSGSWPATCADATELHCFLDGVRLIQRAGALGRTTGDALSAWLEARQQALTASWRGQIESRRRDHRGTYHELQRATIAAYLDDERTLIDALRNARERVLQQFDPLGRQPAEPQRRRDLHYRCLNLQGWVHLAALAGAAGEDLWHFSDTEGRGLRNGLHRLFLDQRDRIAHRDADALPRARLEPLYHAWACAYGELPVVRPDADLSSDPEPLMHAHHGMLPLWIFGRAGAGRHAFSRKPAGTGMPATSTARTAGAVEVR